MLRSLASTPNNGHLPRVKRMRKARVFYTYPPSRANELPIKGGEDLDPDHTILPLRALTGAPLTKKSIPSWTVDAAPPLEPPALSQEIGEDAQSRIVS